MTYLIAVKLKEEREVQIYEFKDEQSRSDFNREVRKFDIIQDIAYSQIERGNNE